MINLEKNNELQEEPKLIDINTNELFDISCNFKVFGFSTRNNLVPINNPEILIDINTPQDYQKQLIVQKGKPLYEGKYADDMRLSDKLMWEEMESEDYEEDDEEPEDDK